MLPEKLHGTLLLDQVLFQDLHVGRQLKCPEIELAIGFPISTETPAPQASQQTFGRKASRSVVARIRNLFQVIPLARTGAVSYHSNAGCKKYVKTLVLIFDVA